MKHTVAMVVTVCHTNKHSSCLVHRCGSLRIAVQVIIAMLWIPNAWNVINFAILIAIER